MNMKKIIGSRITQARKANGLTIKVLAERTGLGAARIGNWEQGTRSPGPEEAKTLSRELRVAASWLLCLTDNPQGEYFDSLEVIF
ncbi:helix-turn-helix domain-containing protein [Legionella bononiensis]|uniref:Helix-turn-helix transcriptional regulator n=2 Tax=Legionella bononiensis TaxID=2793102 RepID=A0ABS1W8R4_9GAMM|nr:helix-turn-helix transcriptional regulator [Legionella bononiensis]MBL7525746.1 helix-turn-helix transcriptional regulator [Legionella bononiensis]MBL7561928.1 helix-turn-helix transcriptional regulator [Legionella bononiensis]